MPGNRVPGYREILQASHQELVREIAPSWVYVTTEKDLAIDYAALQGRLFGGGTVYRVDPLESLVEDPDYAHVPGVSYRVSRARVIEVHESFDASVEYSPTGAALRYATWDDGTHMYGDDGYPAPNATQQELGVTSAALRGLGRGADFGAINALAGHIVLQLHPGITQAQIDVIRRRHGGSAGGETTTGRALREMKKGIQHQ